MGKVVNQILTELQSLNQRVGSLEGDQQRTEDKVDKLGSSMGKRIDSLENGQQRIETNSDKLDAKVDKLETRMEALERKTDKIDSGLLKLETRMENEVIEKIRGLYEYREVQNDVNNQILSALQRIENNLNRMTFRSMRWTSAWPSKFLSITSMDSASNSLAGMPKNCYSLKATSIEDLQRQFSRKTIIDLPIPICLAISGHLAF